MNNTARIRVIFHGAVILLVGLLCGIPTTNEEDPVRFWHTAHESMIMLSVLLFAMSSVQQVLVLPKREAAGLRWSLLATGYGLMAGLLIQALPGQHAFAPSSNPILMIAFLANTTGILGSLLTASLTIVGARAALRAGV